MNRQLKDVKLLRCNSGTVKDILRECDSVIDDIHNRNHNHHSNANIKNKENTKDKENSNNNNDNNNNNEMKQDDNIINNDDKKKKRVPVAFSIQYKNIQNMENVIWSTANTLIRKNEMMKSNNDIDEGDQLPDFTHDVEINQINKINELIQWRAELMKNCISSTDQNS
jgi:hypothetical protein